MDVKENVAESDVLVVGGGIAGCFAAVKAREKGLKVTLVDMGYAGYTGATRFALSGFLVYDPEWGSDLNACMEVIRQQGEYVNDPEWTEIMLRESLARYRDLVSWGADFRVESEEGTPFIRDFLPLTVVRVGEYGTGPACRRQVEKVGVRIFDRIMVTDLVKKGERVVGALGFSLYNGDFHLFKAKATVLAADGKANVSADCGVSPGSSTGSAVGFRAGAEITCNGFSHTWPGTGSYPGGWPSVAARTVFMHFVDGKGDPIELLPNEELVDLKFVFLVHSGMGPIYWDLDSATPQDIARMKNRIRNSYPKWKMKFDPAQGGRMLMDGNGVYDVGGVWLTNKRCATSLPGLFAAGGAAGASILFRGAYHSAPGDGLTPAAVTGARAGAGAAEFALQVEKVDPDDEELIRLKEIMYAPINRKSGFDPRWTAQVIFNTMTPYFITLVKREDRLQAALTIIEFVRDSLIPKLAARNWHELWLAQQVKNMVLNAEMSLRCSLFRTESRGTHYREDYPRRVDPDWLAWVKLKKDGDKMKLWKEPIPTKWWPDLSIPYEERYPRRFPGEL